MSDLRVIGPFWNLAWKAVEFACMGVGREELGGCFSPFYVMNQFSGINVTRLKFNKDFLLGCLDLREASIVHYFERYFTCNWKCFHLSFYGNFFLFWLFFSISLVWITGLSVVQSSVWNYTHSLGAVTIVLDIAVKRKRIQCHCVCRGRNPSYLFVHLGA